MQSHQFLVDVSGSCNLRCPSCPVGNMKSFDFEGQTKRSKGFMKQDYFEKIIHKIVADSEKSNFIPEVYFFNWGEPLINPDIISMIDIAKKNGIKTNRSTNFNVNLNIQDLVKNPPGWMRISISGWNALSYAKSHVGGDINLVKSNIYKLRYLMDKHNVNFPVEVLYHCYKDNLDNEILEAEREVLALGFKFSISYAYFMGFEKLTKYSRGVNFSDEDRKIQDRMLLSVDEALNLGKLDNSMECPLRENQTVINWDGSVALCCTTYNNEHLIALSYLDSSFEELTSRKVNSSTCNVCVTNGMKGYALFSPKDHWNQKVKEKLISQGSKVMLTM